MLLTGGGTVVFVCVSLRVLNVAVVTVDTKTFKIVDTIFYENSIDDMIMSLSLKMCHVIQCHCIRYSLYQDIVYALHCAWGGQTTMTRTCHYDRHPALQTQC